MPSYFLLDRSRGLERPPLAGRWRTRVCMGILLAVAALSYGLIAASPSFAGECNADIGNLMKKRQGLIDDLNKQAKASPKGQLDPTTACGKLRGLAASERELLAYLTKNKDWCMVPDAAITGLETGSKHTTAMAANACKVAEQIKKGQESVGTGPKLPAGPL